MHLLIHFLSITAIVAGALLAAAALLHLIPRMGKPGAKISDALCRPPPWIGSLPISRPPL